MSFKPKCVRYRLASEEIFMDPLPFWLARFPEPTRHGDGVNSGTGMCRWWI